MRLLKPSVFYFALVFGAGFLLGALRVFLVVPRFGTRIAELIEMPLMLVAIVWAARRTNRRFARELGSAARISIGLLALGFMIAAELAVGVALRNESPAESLLDRDPVSGAAYYASLGLFALMPWLLGRRSSER